MARDPVDSRSRSRHLRASVEENFPDMAFLLASMNVSRMSPLSHLNIKVLGKKMKPLEPF